RVRRRVVDTPHASLHRAEPVVGSEPSSQRPLCLPDFFFFNAPPPTEIYTLSLHDALPISIRMIVPSLAFSSRTFRMCGAVTESRSEEHTSELQSQSNLVCRLLLEKKKNNTVRSDHEADLQRYSTGWPRVGA